MLMKRDIYLIGLNHRTASVEVRERFALANHCGPDCWAVALGHGIEEAVILSTCNRVEIVVAGQGPELERRVVDLWAEARECDKDDLCPHIYIKSGLEAVRHLFTVASSLDSMVVGEPQILGQLKSAFRAATAGNYTGAILNRLMHKAFSTAKRVRNETAVASSAVSISYAAVELAKRIFGDMSSYNAMLIGAGEMAELAAAHLRQNGIKSITVANRTHARGLELAEQFGGRAIDFSKVFEHMSEADIIITSTGSTEPIITAKDMKEVLKKRKHSPVFLIDIAVPRDIAPEVNGLDNVYLYDIDDLKEVVEENLANRRDEAVKAARIVDEEVLSFAHWLEGLEVQPTIVELVRRSERIADEELARTLKRLGPLENGAREALEAMASSIVRKLNHAPIVFLKSGMSEKNLPERISFLRDIFNLDSEGNQNKCNAK